MQVGELKNRIRLLQRRRTQTSEGEWCDGWDLVAHSWAAITEIPNKEDLKRVFKVSMRLVHQDFNQIEWRNCYFQRVSAIQRDPWLKQMSFTMTDIKGKIDA